MQATIKYNEDEVFGLFGSDVESATSHKGYRKMSVILAGLLVSLVARALKSTLSDDGGSRLDLD